MAKKRIHLTEGQLHRLIEQSINEISTQTKMSAANKANREADKYWERSNDPNSPNQILARNMRNKRRRQVDTFTDAVNNDMDDLTSVYDTSFWPSTEYNDELNHNQRGSMETYTPPIRFSSYGISFPTNRIPDDERDKKFNDVEQFINGNSYYERGRGWVNPDDEGYDMEKSEPWARIRDKNEAIAHKVAGKVIRLLKESREDMNTLTRMVYDKLYGCFAFGGKGYNPRTQTLSLHTGTTGGATFNVKLPTFFDIDAVAIFNFGEKGELPSVEFAIKRMSPPQYARGVNKKQVVAELTNLYRRSEVSLLQALYRISKQNSNFPSLQELGLELPQ